MLASDCLAFERILLATPGVAPNRWPDPNLITLTDRAVKTMVERIVFPESRLTQIVGNYQELQLPDMHRIYRVYMNGQICVETPGNIDTLEGDQIGFSDQTAQGTVPSGGGGALGGTQAQPQWAVQTPLSYPFLNSWGVPSPRAMPFFPGQRPRYYRRGGFIGFEPPAASGATVTIDCVMVPTTLTGTGQNVIVPDQFLDGIAFRVLSQALRADRDPVVRALAGDWANDFEKEIRLKRTWKRQFSLEDDQFQQLTYRNAYRIGGHRTGGV